MKKNKLVKKVMKKCRKSVKGKKGLAWICVGIAVVLLGLVGAVLSGRDNDDDDDLPF